MSLFLNHFIRQRAYFLRNLININDYMRFLHWKLFNQTYKFFSFCLFQKQVRNLKKIKLFTTVPIKMPRIACKLFKIPMEEITSGEIWKSTVCYKGFCNNKISKVKNCFGNIFCQPHANEADWLGGVVDRLLNRKCLTENCPDKATRKSELCQIHSTPQKIPQM